MHNHIRILSRLANTPLYINEDKLTILSSNIIIPLLHNAKLDSNVTTPTVKETVLQNNNNKIAIIEVFDSLVSKNGAGESGFTSYAAIEDKIKLAIQLGATKIGFYIDSPGGEVSGIFGLTSLIHSLPSIYGVETFSFTDGQACSAAYAIMSSTQRAYSSETGLIGSIGALMTLISTEEADKQKGHSFTILRSKQKKALYNQHEAITQEVIDKSLSLLNIADHNFNKAVALYRPTLSIEDIIKLEGDFFPSEEALKLKLIDFTASSIDEVIQLETNPESKQFYLTNKGTAMTLEEAKAALSAKDTELKQLQDNVTGLVAKAIADERIRCEEIITSGTTLKIKNENIVKRIKAGSSKEDSLEIFTAIAEANSSATNIDTSSNLDSTIEANKNTPNIPISLTVAGESILVSDIMKEAKNMMAKGGK